MESLQGKEITIALDPILSQIMRALAKAKPMDVPIYLEKALWLYDNVDTDLFRDSADEHKRRNGESTASRL